MTTFYPFWPRFRKLLVLYSLCACTFVIASKVSHADPTSTSSKPATPTKASAAANDEYDPFDQIKVTKTRAGVSKFEIPPKPNEGPFELAKSPDTPVIVGETPDGKPLYMRAGDLSTTMTKWEGQLNQAGSSIGDDRIWTQKAVPPSVAKATANQKKRNEDQLKALQAQNGTLRTHLTRSGAKFQDPGKHRTTRGGQSWVAAIKGAGSGAAAKVKNLLNSKYKRGFGKQKRFAGDVSFAVDNQFQPESQEPLGIHARGGFNAHIFNRPMDIVRTNADGELPVDGSLRRNFLLNILGQNVLVLGKESSGLEKRWPVAGPKMELPVPIGPIPIKVGAFAEGVVVANSKVVRSSFTTSGLELRSEPSFEINIGLEAGVDVALAAAGVRGELSLLKFQMPTSAGIGMVHPQKGIWSLVQKFLSNLETTLGSGRISLFARAKGPLCWTCKALAMSGDFVRSCFEKQTRGWVSDKAKAAADKIKNAAKAVADVATETKDKVVDAAGKAVDKAKETAKEVKETAVDFRKDPMGTTKKIAAKVKDKAINVAKEGVDVVKQGVACNFEVRQVIFEFPGKPIQTKLRDMVNPPVTQNITGDSPAPTEQPSGSEGPSGQPVAEGVAPHAQPKVHHRRPAQPRPQPAAVQPATQPEQPEPESTEQPAPSPAMPTSPTGIPEAAGSEDYDG